MNPPKHAADTSATRTRRFIPSRAEVKRWALRGVAALPIVAFAVGHAMLLLWMQFKGVQEGLVNWPAVIAPAAITLLVLPSSWRYWRRWAVMYFIVFICNPVLFLQVLVVTETYVLYSIWIRDREPADLDSAKQVIGTITGRLRRPNPKAPGTAEGADSSPEKAAGESTGLGSEKETDTSAGSRKEKKSDPRAKTGPTPKRPKPRSKHVSPTARL